MCNKSTHDENDPFEDDDITEIESMKENGEQDNGKQDKLLTTNFEVQVENRKFKGS